jgi:hypothetical protein
MYFVGIIDQGNLLHVVVPDLFWIFHPTRSLLSVLLVPSIDRQPQQHTRHGSPVTGHQ